MIKYMSVVLGVSLLLTGCAAKNEKVENTELDVPKKIEQETPGQDVGFWVPEPIPSDLQEKMIGKSMIENGEVSFDNLRVINVHHCDYQGQDKDGVIVVNEKVADEVSDIFKELYEKRYPIEKIGLIDDYDANDVASMVANNTSSFCFRYIEGTKKISKHGYGLAIDINPKCNPQVTKGKVYPSTSDRYADRELEEIGMIKKGDDCYNAFISRGWTWGGDWNSTKDYQHFEKDV